MKRIFIGCFFVMLGLGATTTRGAEATAVEVVLRADQARLAAMMAGDGAALGRLLSDAVLFVHSDGRREGKTDYIKNMTAGDTAYADAKTADVQAKQLTPEVIVLTGAQEMRKKLGPTWSEVKIALHVCLAKRSRHVADGGLAVNAASRQQRRAEVSGAHEGVAMAGTAAWRRFASRQSRLPA